MSILLQANACPKRTTLCRWCATHVTMGDLAEHEDYCGSRTEKCEKCGEFVMLKNFEAHLKNHEYPAYERYKASELASFQSSYASTQRRPSINGNHMNIDSPLTDTNI